MPLWEFRCQTCQKTFEKLHAKNPQMSLHDFQGAMAKLGKDQTVMMTAYTQALGAADPASIKHMMPLDREAKFYADLGRNADKVAQSKPAAASQPHHAKTAAALDKLKGKDNYIGMDELLKESGLSKADLHKAVMDLWKAGAISMNNLEGRHGADPALIDASIHQDVGEDLPHILAYASVKDPEKLKAYLKK